MRMKGSSGCTHTPNIATQHGCRTLPCTCTSAMKSRKSRLVSLIFTLGCFSAKAAPFQNTRITCANPPSLLGVEASGVTSLHSKSRRSPRGIFLCGRAPLGWVKTGAAIISLSDESKSNYTREWGHKFIITQCIFIYV